MKNESEEIEAQRRALDMLWSKYASETPDGWFRFMRDELRYKLEDSSEKLGDVLIEMSENQSVALRCPHGFGKTTFAANVALTSLALIPNLVVLQISPTWRQVKQIFWNELRKWYPNSMILRSMFTIADKAPEIRSRMHPYSWFMVGMASNNPGQAEGFHAAKRILRLTDETKAVQDEIIEATDGALSTGEAWTADFSTPTSPKEGHRYFYNVFHRLRGTRKVFHFKAEDSKLITQKWIDKMALTYGVDSPVYIARVLAEFPMAGDDMLIPLSAAEDFFEREGEPVNKEDPISIGVDVARFGEDESVASIFQGPVLVGMEAMSGKSTTQLREVILGMVRKWQANVVVVDDIGVGGGLTDQLVEAVGNQYLGCDVIGFNASVASRDQDRFKIIGDEVWWLFAEEVKAKMLRSEIADEDLLAQMSSYKKDYDASNRIKVLWPARKERGSDSKSPDRADSVVLAWYGMRSIKGARKMSVDLEDFSGSDNSLEFRGIDKRQF